MAGKYLMGYDVGTTGSKGVIIDQDGTVLASKVMEHGVSVPASLGRAGCRGDLLGRI